MTTHFLCFCFRLVKCKNKTLVLVQLYEIKIRSAWNIYLYTLSKFFPSYRREISYVCDNTSYSDRGYLRSLFCKLVRYSYTFSSSTLAFEESMNPRGYHTSAIVPFHRLHRWHQPFLYNTSICQRALYHT